MIDSTKSIATCKDTLVWDAHAGVFPDSNINLNLLDHWHDHGVNYVSINVGFDVMDWDQTLKTLAAYRNWLLANSNKFIVAGSVKEIADAKANGKLAVSFDIEGMNALNGDINMIGLYHGLGVRQMLFAYNLNNKTAGGCHDKDIGLTPFGFDVVHEMNRVGLIVDCSHASYSTTMDIMHVSDKPVVFSHSNPDTIWPHERNISDDQIKACAKTDGVIGINGMGIFLGNNNSSNNTLLRHIDYLAELVETRHIGLGFDYSPKVDIDIGEILKSRPDFWPAGNGYDTPDIQHAAPSQLMDLSTTLQKHGYSDKDIQGIMGENFKRVATACWGS
ncbi:MAG: membrane dipeptidase [Gammaproteobacteria bacterium]|jgi:membrane dipeptidase|nr:membrane dipeptidase [Gammaproteobacteria bacterium]MBT3724501.1 membrane dipeptidase [Gammaproteobacteria bacterium]MBT4194452.1 membrane dipeptidase [Gammaproteobacteria bacterium]MBT4451134.1 membrane dipeptidase [Gammaproteobacteria bacterium]MBT4863299.1 membrane dipeptidase [Gammaproteobacteria bacterium]